MMQIPVHSAPPSDQARVHTLVAALTGERCLIESLVQTLERQRRAVATNDLTVLDDTVFAAHRLLLNLAQARRRRRSLLELLAGRGDVPLSEFPEALGPSFSDEVHTATEALSRAAEVLADTLARNRRVLEGAMATGDELIRTLVGGNRAPGVYGPSESALGSEGGGRIINRQV